MATIAMNLSGSMKAVSEYTEIFKLPEDFRPLDFILENYVTQQGDVMGLQILSDGRVLLYDNNKAISGWVARKTISYICR